jgi:CrcB protein
MTWVLIAIGGAIGSVARHGVNHWVHGRWLTTFPLGIFVVNVLGSIAIGVVAGVVASARWSVSFETRMFLVVGILGGFTTFSSFSLDTLTLIRGGHFGYAAWNVVGQVGLSLAGIAAGYHATVLALSTKP